ncbi:MAG: 2'-5' RNA ligase [Candidatus Abawacabacteria bacterium RBG_16_42_10]|uniref:RNA 2',3'-cyclic phosphodiesterase n=1 Tax=Candidatus Abawacabacteria bacterium RBG_16_42_10 TaxID=1817814 RepID=A0A1F4XKH3_9BACT|nr:MAG: 2'-5' RNA ligase [Candidatus Abawacabacteria bacterium RBG_16_42_10]
MNSTRLFVALALSKQLKDKIIAWEHGNNLPVRWIIPENLHITLLPPWEENDVEKAKQLFKDSLKNTKSVILQCQDIAYGPEPSSPRLIWINCESSSALRILKSRLEDIFPSPRENRPFVPHITLARFPRRKWKKLQAHELNVAFPWEEKIQAIQLIESKLLPEGAKYQVIDNVDLD